MRATILLGCLLIAGAINPNVIFGTTFIIVCILALFAVLFVIDLHEYLKPNVTINIMQKEDVKDIKVITK